MELRRELPAGVDLRPRGRRPVREPDLSTDESNPDIRLAQNEISVRNKIRTTTPGGPLFLGLPRQVTG